MLMYFSIQKRRSVKQKGGQSPLKAEYAALLARWPGALLGFFILWLFAGAARADAVPASFTARVTAIVDATGLQAENGWELRLVDLEPPNDQAASRHSSRRLADHSVGRILRVDTTKPTLDRHGRVRVITLRDPTDDPRSPDIIEVLVRNGWVMVRPDPNSPPRRIDALMMAENAARQGAMGHWGSGSFAIANATPYSGHIDQFEIVRGRVARVTRIGARLHLEFGADWRKDFTIGLIGPARRFWTEAVTDDRAARLVRARGWVRWWNGPYMEVREPTALELLD